jgi:hypothetical protein
VLKELFEHCREPCRHLHVASRMPVRITTGAKQHMNQPAKNAATTQDLNLSIENAEGKPLRVNPDFALLVALPADVSKKFLSITPRHGDGTAITDAVVFWSWDSEKVASLERTTKGSRPNRIELKAAGTVTIKVTLRQGEQDQQSAALTIVVAPDVVLFGPDGRYYRMHASAWTDALDEDTVAVPVKKMIQHGSVLFTSEYLLELAGEPVGPQQVVTCYVINLASMSNYLDKGRQ